MATRGSVKIVEGDDVIYLYQHWDGDTLPETVKQALIRGESRWGDFPYLARIVFSEMVKDDINGLTGYGISSTLQDSDVYVTIDTEELTVLVRGQDDPMDIDSFIAIDWSWS